MERKHNGIIMYMVVFSLNEPLYDADCNIVLHTQQNGKFLLRVKRWDSDLCLMMGPDIVRHLVVRIEFILLINAMKIPMDVN